MSRWRGRLLRLLHRLQPSANCWQAASGEQALVLVERHQPDLLLLDVRMPGMSGIDLAARLDEAGPATGGHLLYGL